MDKRSLFVYGTLMLDEVVRALTQRNFPTIRATLKDFARYRIRGQVFPGIVPKPGAETEGILLQEVDSAAMEIFDWFEGEQYKRTFVDVTTMDAHVAVADGEVKKLPAEVYVFAEEYRDYLVQEPWNYQRFLRLHADEYVARLVNLDEELN